MATESIATNVREPLDGFTDREDICELFTRLLRGARSGQFRPLAVKGNSGTGKTLLVTYLAERVCPPLQWQTWIIGIAQIMLDYQAILNALENALHGVVSSEENWLHYEQLREECLERNRVKVEVKQAIELSDFASASVLSQNVTVNTQEGRREQELRLRTELSRLLKGLAGKSKTPLCIFIDGYERLAQGDPELLGWLWEDILPGLAQAAPQPLQVMVSGWQWPSNPSVNFVTYVLRDFNIEQVKAYLRKQEVLSSTGPLAQSGDEELPAAFYELSRGLPLVLGMAVEYFKLLEPGERTAEQLRTQQPLIDERARVEFLNDRLRTRLPELDRILLTYAPLLRYLELDALRELLNDLPGGKSFGTHKLNQQTYSRFLQYPFVNAGNRTSKDALVAQPSFHELVRREILEELRRLDPATREQLHSRIATYYREKRKSAVAYTDTAPLPQLEDANIEDLSKADYSEWLQGIPDEQFQPWLEFIYHGMQVKERQEVIFGVWYESTQYLMYKWRRRQAAAMLAVVQQLVEEGEPFLQKQGEAYGRYLFLNALSLQQDGRREEAQKMLGQAAKILEQARDLSHAAEALSLRGIVQGELGEPVEALEYHKLALALWQQAGDNDQIATALANLGWMYTALGEIEQGLSYLEKALRSHREQGSTDGEIATLINLGMFHKDQRHYDEALRCLEEALEKSVQIKNPDRIAHALNCLGGVHQAMRAWDQALIHYQQALAIREQVGNPVHIANSLGNVGNAYAAKQEWKQALEYHERALELRKQI